MQWRRGIVKKLRGFSQGWPKTSPLCLARDFDAQFLTPTRPVSHRPPPDPSRDSAQNLTYLAHYLTFRLVTH